MSGLGLVMGLLGVGLILLVAGWLHPPAPPPRLISRDQPSTPGGWSWADRELAGTLLAILPVYDNLERALAAAQVDPAAGAHADGLRLILRQFDDVLEPLGVTPLLACYGVRFRPDVHEAVGVTDGDPPGLVIEVRRRGFLLVGRLLRPAQVIVSRPPPA